MAQDQQEVDSSQGSRYEKSQKNERYSELKKSQVVKLPQIGDANRDNRSQFQDEILPLDERDGKKKRKKKKRDNSDEKNLPSTDSISRQLSERSNTTSKFGGGKKNSKAGSVFATGVGAKKQKNKNKKKQLDPLEEENEPTVPLDSKQIQNLKLYKDQIKRPELPMDKKLNFTLDDLNKVGLDQCARESTYNQELYLRNFGVNIEVPYFVVLDAYIWAKDPQYIFKIVKYVLPDTVYKTIQHFRNGESTVSTYQNLYGEDMTGNLMLRLLQKGDFGLQQVKEITLKDLQWAKFVQSDDGKFIALLTPEVNAVNQVHREIKIYKSDSLDPEELLNNIENNLVIRRFSEDEKNQINLKHVKHLCFDNNNKKMISWGDTDFYILDIETGKMSPYHIQKDMFEKIYSLNYTTELGKRDQCIVSCKSKNKLQLVVFDFFDDGSDFDEVSPEEVHLRRKQSLLNKLSRKKTGVAFKEMINMAKQMSKDESLPEFTDEILNKNKFPFAINFYGEPTEHLQVKWANKRNDCLIFVDRSDCFVVEFMKDGCHRKRKLTQLKNKVVHFIQEDPDDSGFYILCSREYDERLELEHSHRDEFSINFERQVEPGIIKIFNMQIDQTSLMGTNSKINMRYVGMRDDEFTYDRCTYEEIKQRNQLENNQTRQWNYEQKLIDNENHTFAQISAFSINWPYLSFSGMEDYLVIFDMNAPDYVHRVELSDSESRAQIQYTQITDTDDLFAMVNIKDKYQLFRFDLNANDLTKLQETRSNPYSVFYEHERKPIFEYSDSDVHKKSLIQMHCRGSSHKQVIDFDEKLIVLLLHDEDLYIWVQQQHNDSKTEVFNKKKMRLISDPLGNIQKISQKILRIQNDNCIFFKTDVDETKGGKGNQEIIKRIDLTYSNYDLTTVYVDSDVKDTIKAFNIDNIRQKIMIICESETLTANMPVYTFKIFDLAKGEIEFAIELLDEELIGRLLSGLYTFVDGHIYFNNNVIKIRYDLLQNQTGTNLSEVTIFNKYFQIFPLSDNMRVRSNTPLNSYQSRRFAYIIQDKEANKPKIIRILPYLHARILFLNDAKKNTDYFYTAIETKVKAEKYYNKMLKDQYSKDPKNERTPDGDSSQDEDDELQQHEKVESYSAIVCMSITESEFDVYLQNGMLINHYNFKDIVEKYGEPLAVSPDGTKFIFKQNESSLLNDQFTTNVNLIDNKKLIKDYMTISLLQLSIFGFTHVKDISIMAEMKNCLRENRDQSQPQFTQFKTQNKWLFSQDFHEFKRIVSIELRINDQMDICAKIQQQPKQSDGEKGFKEDLQTIYYLEKCGQNLDKNKLSEMKLKQKFNYEFHQHLENAKNMAEEKDPITGTLTNIMCRVYIRNDHWGHNFQINNRFLFLHDRHKVTFFDFNKDFVDSNLKGLNFEVDPLEDQTHIKQLRMSMDLNTVCIVIGEEEGHVIFQWNIEANCETIMHDVDDLFKIIWDDQGSMYILDDGGNIFFTDILCNVKAYQFQSLKSANKLTKSTGLGSGRGIRMDSKNHNWMIIEEYLALPFSYMTFVIKNFIERTPKEHRSDYVFDPEAYNYILNKSTSFLDGSFVKSDPYELQKVLSNFDMLDQSLLELLHYSQKVGPAENQMTQAIEANPDDILEEETPNLSSSKKGLIEGKFKGMMPSSSMMQTQDQSDDQIVTNSPLHTAIRVGNNKSVDIILQYMAKIDTNGSRMFRDIFHKLISFQNMKTYIDSLPCQTTSMMKKQVMKIKQAYNDEIIGMTESNSVYVDNKFYKDQLNERLDDPNCSSFPVKVVAMKIGWMLNSNDQYDGYLFLQEILRNEDLSFYNLQSLRMVIEFLYKKIKVTIFILQLPCYLGNQLLFVAVALVNESLRSTIKIPKEKDTVSGNTESADWTKTLIACLVLNLLFVMIQAVINCFMFRMMGIRYLQRLWTWVDIFILTISLAIMVQYLMLISKMGNDGSFKENYDEYMDQTILLRIMLMFGQVLLFLKSQQFLTMVDQIAPLISIAQQIMIDIVGFMIILIIFMFTFSFSFFIMAQNQLNFDNLNDDEKDSIPYATFVGSLTYIGNMIVGQTDQESFTAGDGRMEVLLNIVFWCACFIIMIHLLNMLIAIMGNTFAVGHESMEQQKYREHLRFVVDNWFMRSVAFRDIDSVKYIITAFSSNEDEHDDTIFHELKEEVALKTSGIFDQLKKQDSKIKDIQRMIIKLIKASDPDG